ncbi:hypothetical protein [Clostridium ljungdahlii]|uniref:Uncharacterized protein n=1 Tax=Clostridium ljungdahlii TaxID=1538 RepID=A0A162NA48_9CLOT|nr:hypothetical protein [Clostridium ljungdahlii]OAA90879.1 hypothetical protein WY13_00945 [Clostridium ljungdahlii]
MMIKNEIVEVFERRIDDVVVRENLPNLQERFKAIEQISEDYYQQTEKILPSYLLNRLGDWVLEEVLKDKTVDKVANDEYAVLSYRQIRRRTKRENSVSSEVMDYLDLKMNKNYSSLLKTVRRECD